MHTCIHTNIYIHTYIHTCIHIYACTHIQYMCTHTIYTCINTYIYIYIHVHASYLMSTRLTLWILNSEKVMDTKPRCISVATGWVMGSNCPNPTQAWSWDSSKSDDLC